MQITEADYLLFERIAIKMDSHIPEDEAVQQAEEELAPRQRDLL